MSARVMAYSCPHCCTHLALIYRTNADREETTQLCHGCMREHHWIAAGDGESVTLLLDITIENQAQYLEHASQRAPLSTDEAVGINETAS